MFAQKQLRNETQERSEPGMPYDRRQLLSLSLKSFLVLGIALPAIAQSARRANQWKGFGSRNLNWDAFLESLERFANTQYQRYWNQARYVEDIAALARSLELLDPHLIRAFRATGLQRSMLPRFADLEKRTSFQVVLITFEKGQSLPFHDHPRMTGVMTCATGEIDVRSLHELASGGQPNTLMLRDEGVVRMTTGMVGSLTASSHNIHGLRANSFAQVIDIFTPPYDPTRIRESRYFQLVQENRESNMVKARVLSKV